MSKGFLWFAQNNSKTDYVELSIKLAKSINAFSLTEIKKRNKFAEIKLIKATDKEIITGFRLLAKEGIFLDGSSSAIIGSLGKIKCKII